MAILGSVTFLPKPSVHVAVFNGRKIEDDTIVYQSATRQHATLEGAIKQAKAGMGAKGEVYASPVAGVENLWLLTDAAPATPMEKAAEKAPKAK